jgi:GTP-binding protein
MTDTRGTGTINTNFLEFRSDNGTNYSRPKGSLVAHESGTTSLYGLVNSQERGNLFIGPGVPVYKGQVVGQNSRKEDISVNVCRQKQLSNMRSKGDGPTDHFDTPVTMGLEDALEYIDDSELVEVTPKNVRIRKIVLDPMEEKRKKSQGIV